MRARDMSPSRDLGFRRCSALGCETLSATNLNSGISMLWSLFVFYVVLSQIFVVGVLLYGLFSPGCDGIKHLNHLNPLHRWLSILITFIGGIVLAPAIAPFLVYLWNQLNKQVDAEFEYIESVQRSHQELMLEPLHRDNIDDELWNHFEEEALAIVDLGYSVIEDVWLKGEPQNSKARILLQRDGHTFVEIGRVFDICYTELVSFLDDGSVVSSATCDPIDIEKQLAKNGYYINACPELTGVELMQSHDQFLDRMAEGAGVEIRCVPESQWKAYFQYHNRRFSEIKHLIGKSDEACEAIFPEAGSSELAAEPATPSGF